MSTKFYVRGVKGSPGRGTNPLGRIVVGFDDDRPQDKRRHQGEKREIS